jgi:aquaporin Z
MIAALSLHWPRYLIEGALLGLFMLCACVSVVVMEHPGSPVRRVLPRPGVRRALVGAAMGVTAAWLIYSPWGQRSGAHMNPATTLTFLCLGKVTAWDALFYVISQCLGGTAGVVVSGLLLGGALGHPSVNYIVTAPGPRGPRTAWAAEFVIAFGLMTTVLWAGNDPVAAPYTGLFAASLVALYIAVESPWSGMSLNPARSLASAIPARQFRSLWVYMTAPPAAMLAAAAVYTGLAGSVGMSCSGLVRPGDGARVLDVRIRGRHPSEAGCIEDTRVVEHQHAAIPTEAP